MTMYCTCTTCKTSPAQPKAPDQDRAETIPGAPVILTPGQTLAHWSARTFTQLLSTEIHDFVQKGHGFRVGASFFLYDGAPPTAMPKALSRLGLGGTLRYTIDAATANAGMQIYRKVTGNPQEVAVVLGCGGSITFDAAGAATGIDAYPDRLPILTIPR